MRRQVVRHGWMQSISNRRQIEPQLHQENGVRPGISNPPGGGQTPQKEGKGSQAPKRKTLTQTSAARATTRGIGK